MALKGFSTIADAAASNSCTGYRAEVIDLSSPWGGACVGTGYALLARSGYDLRSALGCTDARLHLPDEWIDGAADVARALGVVA